MANIAFNIGAGREVELYNRVKSNDPANSAFVVVLLKAVITGDDNTLKDFATLSALLGDAAVTECDFTNYARLTFTDTELAALPAPDNTNNQRQFTLPNAVFTDAGGATNNTITSVVICYDPDTTAGTDANIEPLFCLDYAETTSGSTLDISFPTNFYSATQS